MELSGQQRSVLFPGPEKKKQVQESSNNGGENETRRKISLDWAAFLLIGLLLGIISPVDGDTEVSCVFMERCILPCSFQFGPQVVIHWFWLKAGELRVHSFYNNQDQLGHQDQKFRGRTSLFKEQISRGDASLQLTGVKVQDEGRYQCHTSTISGNKESFINLRVDAPVHEVNIDQVGNRITCSSNWIYPEPELTWSTTPPSKETFKNPTTVQQTGQQLYNISSSLILSDSDNDLVYSCTISTRRNKRRATLFKPTSIIASATETTISCSASNTSLTNFSLVWRFNHSQIILDRTRTDVSSTVSEEWRQQVKDVSESGSLTLQDLSSNQTGIYTCELRDDEETLRTDTLVRIGNDNDNTTRTRVFIGGMVLAAAAALTGVVLCLKKKTEREETPAAVEDQGMSFMTGEQKYRGAGMDAVAGEVKEVGGGGR